MMAIPAGANRAVVTIGSGLGLALSVYGRLIVGVAGTAARERFRGPSPHARFLSTAVPFCRPCRRGFEDEAHLRCPRTQTYPLISRTPKAW